jgi:hypothetical protein
MSKNARRCWQASSFAQVLPLPVGLHLRRRQPSDAVQPGAERVGPAEPTCLAHQQQERGLKGVVGVVAVVQHAPADAQHHWAMPSYQHGKGFLVALVGKPFEEPPIAQFIIGAADFAEIT